MKLSLITINYNGAEDTIRLLDSLREQTDRDFDLFVVDNGSERPDADRLERHISELGDHRILFVQNRRNLGFSGGNNSALRLALLNGADWLFLINNDTWLEKTSVELIKANLSATGGIIGIPLAEGENIAYCGRVKWLKPTLKHLYSFGPAKKVLEKKRGYIIGGGMLVHSGVFASAGLFDERYFLYFEDADFSLRARKAGFDLDILEEVRVHHKVAASSKKLGSPLLLRYHFRNAHLFNLKHAPWPVRFILPLWSGWILCKQFIKLFLLPHRFAYTKAITLGVFDFYRSNWGKLSP